MPYFTRLRETFRDTVYEKLGGTNAMDVGYLWHSALALVRELETEHKAPFTQVKVARLKDALHRVDPTQATQYGLK